MGRDGQGPSGPGDALASTSAPGDLQPPLSQDFCTGRWAAPSRGTGDPGAQPLPRLLTALCSSELTLNVLPRRRL